MLRREFLSRFRRSSSRPVRSIPAWAEFSRRGVDVRRARRARLRQRRFRRAALSPSSDQQKLAPVRFQVMNKPGGGRHRGGLISPAKRADPHVIAAGPISGSSTAAAGAATTASPP